MSIDMNKLLSMNGVNIIDIREKYKYESNHIKGAINIPYSSLIANPSYYLDKGITYYLYCDSGSKSKIISDELNYLGYNTIDVIGGFNYYLLIK